MDLAKLGKYSLSGYFVDPKFNLVSFVLNGIPHEFNIDNLAREIAEMNPSLNISPEFEDVAVQYPKRLSRFHRFESGMPQNFPSKSVMVYVHKNFVEALTNIKVIRVEYIFCPINLYKKKLIRCMRCKKWGYHLACNCHALIECNKCGGPHE